MEKTTRIYTWHVCEKSLHRAMHRSLFYALNKLLLFYSPNHADVSLLYHIIFSSAETLYLYT